MPPAKKQSVDIRFPTQGVVEGTPHSAQPPGTTPDAQNVRPHDVEEDRVRGGRRDGVVKITGGVVDSVKIDFIGDVRSAGESTEAETGAISQFDVNHLTQPGQLGKLGFKDLVDGQTLKDVGLPYFCRNKMGMDLSQNGPGVSGWADYKRTLGCNPLYERMQDTADDDTAKNNVIPINNIDRSGITKRTDDDEVAYLEFLPANCTVDHGCEEDGTPFAEETWTTAISAMTITHAAETFAGEGQTVVYKKLISIMPRTEYDQQPWNSEKSQKFSTSITFLHPPGYGKMLSGTSDEKIMRFVQTEADATAANLVYDPWYVQTMTRDSLAWSGTANDHKFKFRNKQYGGQASSFGHYYRWGLIFRIKFNEAQAKSGNPPWEDWCDNGDGSNDRAFAVYFEKDARATDQGGRTTHLYMAEIEPSDEDSAADARRGFSPSNPFLVKSGAIGGSDTDKHTLEVRGDGNAFSVYVDGNQEYTTTNITLDLPNVGGESEPTETAASFAHTMFFYTLEYSAERATDAREDNDARKQRIRRQMEYFGSYDWTKVGYDSDGDGVNEYVDVDKNGSDELRLYDWSWRDINTGAIGKDALVAVSGGKVYDATPVDPGIYRAVSTTQDLETTSRRVDGVEFFQNHYFVDGKNYKYYRSSDRTVNDWDADDDVTLPGGDGSTGSFGSGASDGNDRCTIIERFQGRIVMSGNADEPQNWFMSAVGDADDWDTSVLASIGGAVSGSSGELGEVADPVMALAPAGDTRLIIGSSNSMYAMTGDPGLSDTQIITLSRDTGIVGPDAWCYGPNRILYFMSENGLYAIQPNEYDVSQTNRLSAGKLDKTFRSFDYASVHVRLAYDEVNHGVHIFMTPTRQLAEAQNHFFYDQRTNSFWPMEYPSVMGPTYIYDYKSMNPDNRTIMLGGFDGHIRKFSTEAEDDDGTAIDSYVWIGPIEVSSTREVKLVELLGILDEQTIGLDYEVYAADTVEQAKAGTPVFTGSWLGGRNTYVRSRARGAAIFIKLLNGTKQAPWALERIAATLAVAGRARVRS
jgi:hypothetical protein